MKCSTIALCLALVMTGPTVSRADDTVPLRAAGTGPAHPAAEGLGRGNSGASAQCEIH
ncbi:hypothetical protein SAMN05444159_0781 [Bradyrhizobium lablabi]|uniref:Uncharacterized protein n=1 Tax=Bradyrhizobium lablabi TaxID=722472 RepID=A0A1M6JUK5_9BRAD|nr:hypothetical protein SAMN05444159_0781 [Bradyrhizobium lablabi]